MTFTGYQDRPQLVSYYLSQQQMTLFLYNLVAECLYKLGRRLSSLVSNYVLLGRIIVHRVHEKTITLYMLP